MSYYVKTLVYLMILYFSVVFVASSTQWLSAWVALEVNMMVFIPLMKSELEGVGQASTVCMKYFLVQALSSTFLALFSFLALVFSSFNSAVFTVPLLMALLIKIGAAPFHLWVPDLVSKLSWGSLMILLTLQKIPGLLLIWGISTHFMSLVSGLVTAFLGALGGVNQNSLRKLLAYSSISNLGWLLVIMHYSSEIWTLYFLIYLVITLMACLSFKLVKLSFITQVFNSGGLDHLLSLLSNLLSLGGVPPFLGFCMKWIAFMIINTNPFILLTLILTSLVTLFMYLRVCIAALCLLSAVNLKGSTPTASLKLMYLSFMVFNFTTLPILVSFTT